jgi:hypothetical protein
VKENGDRTPAACPAFCWRQLPVAGAAQSRSRRDSARCVVKGGLLAAAPVILLSSKTFVIATCVSAARDNAPLISWQSGPASTIVLVALSRSRPKRVVQ